MKNLLRIEGHIPRQQIVLLVTGAVLTILMAVIFLFGLRTPTSFQTSAIEESIGLELTYAQRSAPPAMATPFPISTPAEAMPLAGRLMVTPPVGGQVITLTTIANATGWSSDLDGRSHFNMPIIHAGIYQGHTYYGLLQFDLSPVPAGSTISYASVEVVGQDDTRLGSGGAWQLALLETEVAQVWPLQDFEGVTKSNVVATIPLAQEARELAPDQANQFIFSRKALAELERRLLTGTAAFRLDGPTSGEDNLFSWDSGHHKRPDDNRMIVLSLVVMSATTLVDATSADYVIVTSTPTPENIITAAAMAAEATQQADAFGTATSVPENWVTPVIITPRPNPANQATALFQKQEATAHAFLFGPATATPPNVWTTTPAATSVSAATVYLEGNNSEPTFSSLPTSPATATPVYVVLEGEVATPWVPPSPTPTESPVYVPSELVGKIAFLSNRSGGPNPLAKPLVYLIDPDGSNLAVMTGQAVYETVLVRESFSADQRFRVFVKDALRFDNKQVPALYVYDSLYRTEEQITRFGAGAAWDPVWSPTREQIAFISNDSGDDEIWIINRDGTNPKQLTDSNRAYNSREIGKDTFVPEINGHPSWSPDGSQLVFWSNRTGNRQIWVMNADGSNLYSLSTTNHDDWNPVWIKYPSPTP